MRNIFGKNEAAAVLTIAAIVVIIAIVVAGIGVYVYYSDDIKEYWETETAFGMWQDEITIVYADGTTESFKLIQDGLGSPFTVYHEGAEIVEAIYTLSAEVTGENFEGAELLFEDDFKITGQIAPWQNIDNNRITNENSKPDGSTTQISLGTTEEIFSHGLDLTTIVDENSALFPDGFYWAKFALSGTCKYRGYPDGGAYVDAVLPIARLLIISVTRGTDGNGGVTGTIVVTLTSGTSTT